MNYKELAELYSTLEKTSKRLDKTYFISKFLKKAPIKDLDFLPYLIQGRVFPPWDERKIGFSTQLMIKAIANTYGASTNEITKLFKKFGDLGSAAEELNKTKSQRTLFSQNLKVIKVFENIRKLSELEGQGTVNKKIQLVSELLSNSKPIEAKFITRTILEQLRVGVGEGSLRDALVWAYFPKVISIFYQCPNCKNYVPKTPKCLECKKKLEVKDKEELKKKHKNALYVEDLKDLKNLKKYDFILTETPEQARKIYNHFIERVQKSYDVSADFSAVAIHLKQDPESIEKLTLEVGKPIKVMLYQKEETIEEGFKRVGKPAALEYKYDGFRLELHKTKGKAKLFTRRLEDVTKQFPDVKELIEKNTKGDSFILDAEIIGLDEKTGQWLPFQAISQRIKRKYHIEEAIKKTPVIVNVFDLMEYNNNSTMDLTFKERRKLLEKIVKPIKNKFGLAEQLITSDLKEAEEFYQQSLAKGNEGIMMKNLEGIYKPGSRVGYGIKIKPTMETLDLVIVKAQWGEGKRSEWLSSFTLATRKGKEFLEIGKVGTGIKEKSEGVTFKQLTKLIKPLIISQKGKDVEIKPSLVIEIAYEEIQKSPTYSSGYALRFPRVVRLRPDRRPQECSDLKEVVKLYNLQRGRS